MTKLHWFGARGIHGQDALRRQAEAVALAGLRAPLVIVPLQSATRAGHDGLFLKGRTTIGPAGRALEVRAKERLVSGLVDGGDAALPVFDLSYHGLMLPGAYCAIPMTTVPEGPPGLHVWRGEHRFLTGHFKFHLVRLGAILPGHGWIATLHVAAAEAGQ